MHGKTIVILTGAGISAESGLATFRDHNGLWCNHRIEDVATPEAFQRNPALVHQFYNMRRAQLKEAAPNAAHLALAELAQHWEGRLLLVTQNVDDLHDRAGEGKTLRDGYNLLHMHGELRKARCLATEQVFDWDEDMSSNTPCPCCKQPQRLRPHIVWFGEMPLRMEFIYQMLRECDLFLSIGTSGNVYPAAGFVHEVRSLRQGHTVELNMEPSSGHSLFHEKIYGPATRTVPEFTRRILAGDIL
jgi:NAD-dependent deacetylase